MSENTKLTEEQVHQVYAELAPADEESTKALAEASNETNTTEYDGLTEIDNKGITAGVWVPEKPEEIKEAKEDYIEAMKEYDISDEEALALYEVILAYKNGKKKGIYEALPIKMKILADGIYGNIGVAINNRVHKDAAAAFLIDSIINDAKFNKIFDDYDREVRAAADSMNTEFEQIMSDALNDSFEKIEQIRVENPAVADKIKAVQDAFKRAEGFDLQLQWLEHVSAKKLNKLYDRSKYGFLSFNKRVNKTSIKIPDITELPEIIRFVMPEISEEMAGKFTTVLAESLSNLPVDTDENIANIAYIYKLIDNIYRYKYISYTGEAPEAYFNKIKEVISRIEAL